VSLAAAILHRPRVLVLDEPTVGLDPRQIIAIRELIRELGSERTLLLSTHILPEVELLCDRVLIIDRGRIVAHGTPAELRERSRGLRSLRVELGGAGAGVGTSAAEVLAALPGVASVTPTERPAGEPALVHLEVDEGADPREAVFRAAVAHGWVLLEMAEERASLEDVFVRLTTYDEVTGEEEVAAVEAELVSAAAEPPAPPPEDEEVPS
jgi:ABC-2 type transport system ATP-binding protein